MKFKDLTIGDLFASTEGHVYFKADLKRARALGRWTKEGVSVAIEIYEYPFDAEAEVTRITTTRLA